jgi:ATP-binding cassette subfamily B protein
MVSLVALGYEARHMADAVSNPDRSAGAAFAQEIAQDKDKRAKARSLRPLAYLWPYVWRYKFWLLAFLIFLVLSAAASLTLPLIFKLIVDCGFGDNADNIAYCQRVASSGATELSTYFKFAMGFVVLFAALGSARYFFITALGQRVIADIRRSVYSKLLTLSPAYFERVRTGEVLSRLTTDTTLIETVLTGSISFAIRSVAIIIGSFILMFVVSWKLALIVMAVLPIILVPSIIQGRRIRVLSRDGQDNLAYASARSGEALTAIQTVQAYTREAHEDAAFADDIEATYKSQFGRILNQTFLTFFVFTAALGGIIGALWFGAESVKAGTMTGGDIVAFTGLAFYAGSSGGALTETWTNLLRAAGASERLVDILETQSDISVPTNPVRLTNVKGNLAFENLSFAYPTRPDDKALYDVSFDVKAGETVALVGPSGAGKSTIFQLLLRFYDVSSGVIKLDGVKLSDLSPDTLRQQFAIVQQNTPLFSGSAMDNIRYGRIGASDAEVIAAAKAAFAHDFISALPDGYDTDLGERAGTLSGGQRQRLAIARAILRDAPILLLDEATSALDAESEQAVQKAFEMMSQNRTTLVIAHRLATVKTADRIIVFENGRIVGQGTHDSLIKDGELYARLAALQFDQN